MILNSKKFLCLVLSTSLSLTGCSSFRSSTQTMTVTTDQSDAQIYINGAMVGAGSAQTLVQRNQNASIMVKKDGYVTIQRNIGKSLNTTGILDIIGGVLILLPLFGLMAAGAYSLDETNVSIVMVKS